MVEGENHLLNGVLWWPFAHQGMYVPTHAQINVIRYFKLMLHFSIVCSAWPFVFVSKTTKYFLLLTLLYVFKTQINYLLCIYLYIHIYVYINSFLKAFWRGTVLEIKTKVTVLSRQYSTIELQILPPKYLIPSLLTLFIKSICLQSLWTLNMSNCFIGKQTSLFIPFCSLYIQLLYLVSLKQ